MGGVDVEKRLGKFISSVGAIRENIQNMTVPRI